MEEEGKAKPPAPQKPKPNNPEDPLPKAKPGYHTEIDPNDIKDRENDF